MQNRTTKKSYEHDVVSQEQELGSDQANEETTVVGANESGRDKRTDGRWDSQLKD
jgi:hypothetical protein